MTRDDAIDEFSTNETNVEQTGDITLALMQKDYDTVIALVREAFADDPDAVLADPVINDQVGRRYRNIFIQEALANPDTAKNGTRKPASRSI